MASSATVTQLRGPTAEQRHATERLLGATLALPFIGVSKSGIVSTHWAPRLSGSYHPDLVIGGCYARAFIAHLRAERQRFLLGSIIQDMVERGDLSRDTGVISGFATAISDALIA